VLPLPCGACVLRLWRASDLDSLVRHANNRNVWLGLRNQFPYPYTREAGRSWLEASVAEHPPTALAIEVAGEAAGGIGVVPGRDVNSHSGEIGYWLGEPHWGQGIATAAVRGFVPWVAATFGLRRLFAEIFATNLASMRVLEKCGFEREGVLRQHALKDGRYVDQVVYGLLID
jgi:ribosomal-protein-alanine N-acetyltransferase